MLSKEEKAIQENENESIENKDTGAEEELEYSFEVGV